MDCPKECRCDNVGVSEFMLNYPERGPGHISFITGRSVHNQRIERLWRDVYVGCISLFYDLFYQLEDDGLLNMSSNTDLFALHYILIPRINRQLDVCREPSSLMYCQKSKSSPAVVKGYDARVRWWSCTTRYIGHYTDIHIHGVPKRWSYPSLTCEHGNVHIMCKQTKELSSRISLVNCTLKGEVHLECINKKC